MPVYSRTIQKAVKSIRKPFDSLMVNLVELPGDTIVIKVYESNINEFSEAQRMEIMEYLMAVEKTILAYGVKCFIDGVPT